MAKFMDALNENLREFIGEQAMFFTATAPAEGRINLSPKGIDTFRCLSDRRVAYLDLTGSGNETAAHLGENDRMTIMFCSFGRTPMILRLYGRGRVAVRDSDEWAELIGHFEELPGARQIILLDIESVQTSCGYAVPMYELVGERDTLIRWAEQKGEAELDAYRRENNAVSIDGRPI